MYRCPQSVHAVMARITRLNACGQAVDPLTPNSRNQFAAFSTMSLKPDIQKGADITVVNAAGQICIRDRDLDRLKGFDVTWDLCGIPLTVLEMILGAAVLPDTNAGDFKGAVMRDSRSAPALPPKALELWSIDSNKAQCISSSGARPYVQWLLPFTKNWEISGNIDFDYTKPVTIQVTGYAEKNYNWFPAWPGAAFPSYIPGGGDPTGSPDGAAPCVLPAGVVADPWNQTDQENIQAGGPLAWAAVAALPTPGAVDCGFVGTTAAS